MSFGADEDAGEDEETVIFQKKSIVRPDCMFPTPHEFFVSLTLIVLVVENPKTVAAAPDFISQPSASTNTSLNVPKEIPKEPKVKNFAYSMVFRFVNSFRLAWEVHQEAWSQ